MTNYELREYLVEEAGYAEEEIENYDSYMLLNAWLEWNGMCGWTDDILKAVKASGITETNYYKEEEM